MRLLLSISTKYDLFVTFDSAYVYFKDHSWVLNASFLGNSCVANWRHSYLPAGGLCGDTARPLPAMTSALALGDTPRWFKTARSLLLSSILGNKKRETAGLEPPSVPPSQCQRTHHWAEYWQKQKDSW
jgi:hypothetical protein